MQEVAQAATSTALDKNIIIVVATMLVGILTSMIGLWKANNDQRNALSMFTAQREADRRDREEQARISHDEREEIATRNQQARLDVAAADKAEREDKAKQLVEVMRLETEAVRTRLELTATRVRDQVDASAASVRAALEATNDRLRDRVDASAQVVVAQVDRKVEVATGAAASALDAQTVKMMDAIKAATVITADKADAAYHEANNVNVKIEKLHKHNELQAEALKNLLEIVKEQARLQELGQKAALATADDSARQAAGAA